MKVFLLSVLVLPLLMVGCATVPKPPPLTMADVISMTKGGMADADIVQRIETTHTVFRLGAADVARLQKDGVSDRVINFMLETHPRAAVEEQRRLDASFYNGYYFGPPYYRRPWR